MSRKPSSNEAKLMRRLNTYPTEMFAILTAATEGKNYERSFNSHAEANAFLHRYYRFRLDLLEAQGGPETLNAKPLTGMRASGVDAAGERFDSKKTDALPPIKITWYNENSFMNILPEQIAQSPEQLSFTAGTQPVDRAEEAVKRWLNLPTIAPTECVHEWNSIGTECTKCRTPHPDMLKG